MRVACRTNHKAALSNGVATASDERYPVNVEAFPSSTTWNGNRYHY